MADKTRHQIRKARGGWYVEDTSTGATWMGLTRVGAMALADRFNRNAPAVSSETPVAVAPSQDKPRLWSDMTPADFGKAQRPVQGALFQKPDAAGTLALFDSLF